LIEKLKHVDCCWAVSKWTFENCKHWFCYL